MQQMRRFLAFGLFALVTCSGSDSPDNSPEWLHVLSRKKAAVAPNATARERQMYADSVAAFTKKYPAHGRAREVYQRIQLEFARELASLGRYQDSIRFYRAVLNSDPTNVAALRGVADAFDHLAISRLKLLALQKGMSQREVAHVLGAPIPGWTVHTDRRDSVIDSWYYRTTEGGVAGVYFRDGELFAAEENSHTKIVPLSQARSR
jgi:tetratricopeptide (TPR) repeat protein